MKTAWPLLASFWAITLAPPGAAHPGGTNAEGCHTNRQTGDYHCHAPKQPNPDRINYCHVIDGEHRCGYSREACDDLASENGGYCRRQ
jgi:hypothetical protein